MIGVDVAKRNGFTRLGRLSTTRVDVDEGVLFVGSYRGIDIRICGCPWQESNKHVCCTVNDGKDKQKIIMTIDLEYEHALSRGKSVNFYSVAYVSVDHKYQGFGIAPKIYSKLLKSIPIGIVSGDTQSVGGQSIWKKLLDERSVSVLAFRTPRSLREVEIDGKGRINADDPNVNIWDEYAPDEHIKPWRLVAFNEGNI